MTACTLRKTPGEEGMAHEKARAALRLSRIAKCTHNPSLGNTCVGCHSLASSCVTRKHLRCTVFSITAAQSGEELSAACCTPMRHLHQPNACNHSTSRIISVRHMPPIQCFLLPPQYHAGVLFTTRSWGQTTPDKGCNRRGTRGSH